MRRQGIEQSKPMLTQVLLAGLLAFQATDTPTATLQGTVVRAGTSEGLSKALVEMYSADVGALSDYDFNERIWEFIKGRQKTFTATTDNKGTFSISGIPPGNYRLSALRNGFVRSEHGQRGANDQGAIIRVLGGGRLPDAIISMPAAPTISGTVVDENERPVAFASVLALVMEYQPGGTRRYRLVQSVNTDDRGNYRLFWLSPGEYAIAVNQSEGAMHEIIATFPQVNPNLARPEIDYPLYYYPNTPDIDAARTVRAREGLDVPSIDIKIRHIPLATIRGKVTNMPAGSRGTEFPLGLFSTTIVGSNASFRYRPDAEGKFEIPGVAPGTYVLRGIHQAAARTVTTSEILVTIADRDLENFDVPLVPAVEARGKLLVEGASGPLPFDAAAIVPRLTARAGKTNISLSLRPDGTIVTNDPFFPGDFDVSILGLPTDYYLKKVTVESGDALGSGIHVSTSPFSMDLVVAKHAGILTGTVGSALSPASGSVVVLIPEEEMRVRRDRYRRVTTDMDGKFRLSSVPPGRYTAFAFDRISSDASYDPDFLAQYQSRGTTVTVEENQDRTLDLRLLTAEQ